MPEPVRRCPECGSRLTYTSSHGYLCACPIPVPCVERDRMTERPKLPTGVWRRARWDWAYRFVLPKEHPRAGTSVYGCGFATREAARAQMRRVKTEYEVER